MASPPQPSPSLATAPLATSGFSSFSAAAFQQSVHFQHLQSTQAQAQAQLAGITQLAQHYLQSSSDSEPGGSKRDLLDPPSPPSSPPSPAHLTQPPLKRSKLSSKHKDKKGGKQKRARTSTAASERHQQRQEVLRAEQRLAAATAAARGLGKAVGAGVTGLGAGFPWSSAAPSIVPSGPPALYFDTRGDFQNLVYRGLYATNIAAFARRDPLGLTPAAAARRARRAANWLDVEQGGGRYWHAAQVLAQRDRGLRRLHLAAPAPSPSSSSSSTVAPLGGYTALGSSRRRLSRALPLPTYIPLHAPPTGARPGSAIPTAFGHQQGGAGRLEGLAGGSGGGEEEGETLDQWVLRRTQEFSVATRAQPHRCQLWLDYAAWQDQAARLVGRRPARQGGAGLDAAAVAEKKVAILEHGLQLNPGEVRLLTALLEAAGAGGLLEGPALASRWEAAIRRWQAQQQQQQQQQEGPEGLGLQLGTACLWRTYLQLRQATFSVYSFQALQGLFTEALGDMSRGVVQAARAPPAPLALRSQLQQAALGFALDFIYSALQAGHQELGVARLQALLEYQLCAPLGPGGQQATAPTAAAAGGGVGGAGYSYGAALRLFSGFWEAGAPRLGAPGAAGWAAWFSPINPALHPMLWQAAAPRPAVPLPAAARGAGPVAAPIIISLGRQGGRQGMGTRAGEAGGRQEGAAGLLPAHAFWLRCAMPALLMVLELEGVKQRGVGPDLLSRWVAVEQQRSQAAGQWALGAGGGKEGKGRAAVVGQGERAATPAQRYQLALAALALLGVPLGGGWLSTNLPLLLLPEPCPWYAEGEGRRAGVAALLSQLLQPGQPLEGHGGVALAYLLVEASQANGGGQQGVLLGGTPAHRPAGAGADGPAGQLLGGQRCSLALWGALAALEGLAGNHKMCSRVYSSSLAAAPSLPLRQRLEQLPPLVLQAAQQELCSGQQGLAAALGLQERGGWGGKLEGRPGGPTGGEPGQAYTAAVAAVARAGHLLVWLLAAAAGAWQHPGTHMGWAALVAAAGLLEVVVGRLAVWGGQGAGAGAAAQRHEEGGVGSALVVLKNTVAGAPLEVRRISPAHEWLQVFFCEVLVSEACSGSTQLSPARIRAHLAEALVVYPHNPSLLQLLVVTEQRAHAHVRLRHYLHTACAAGPTPQLLATCLACEASSGIPDGRPLSAQPALRSRLHAIFERSAADKRLAVCPQLWLMYLSYEAECSNAEAVRRVFLRAVRACPGCKDVWMAGFAASAGMAANEVQQASLAAGGRTLVSGDAPAGAALSAREAAELLEVMAAKGLHVYTDVAEVVMMALEDE
ncbi:NRDE-2, necessary for RNA interference-domain-containing protein [Haematococcus lacustris]